MVTSVQVVTAVMLFEALVLSRLKAMFESLKLLVRKNLPDHQQSSQVVFLHLTEAQHRGEAAMSST